MIKTAFLNAWHGRMKAVNDSNQWSIIFFMVLNIKKIIKKLKYWNSISSNDRYKKSSIFLKFSMIPKNSKRISLSSTFITSIIRNFTSGKISLKLVELFRPPPPWFMFNLCINLYQTRAWKIYNLYFLKCIAFISF